MEFRQLRYFKVIADARSFAGGAQDLRVAQPALSRSIAKLEDEIGQGLFVRHSSGVSLTDAGRLLYDYATQVLGSVQELVEGMAASQSALLQGEVAFGAPQSIQATLVLPVAAEFLKEFPSCKLSLMQNSSGRLREHLLRGTIDMAILPNVSESGMHIRPLVRESMCLILPEGKRGEFADSIEVNDLLALPLVLTGYPDSLLLMMDRLFPRLSDSLNIRCEANSSSVLVDLVARGVGYGIAPSNVVSQIPDRQLDFVPIRGIDVTWAIAINWQSRGRRAVAEMERRIVASATQIIAAGHWPTGVVVADTPNGDF